VLLLGIRAVGPLVSNVRLTMESVSIEGWRLLLKSDYVLAAQGTEPVIGSEALPKLGCST